MGRKGKSLEWEKQRKMNFARGEREVGIECFIADNVAISGIVKHRWSDFHVREVDAKGTVARLTTFDVPPTPIDENEEPAEKADSFKLSDEDKANMDKVAKGELKETEIGGSGDKAVRSMIHLAVRHAYPTLESVTVERKIMVRKSKGGARKKSGKGHKWRFVLWKENTDTADALFHLSRAARANQKGFFQAGTKDKRGVTTQFITTYVEPTRLIAANKKLKSIRIGNVELHEGEHLKLGNLQANQFRLVLRDCVATGDDAKRRKLDLADVVVKSAANFNKLGFVNYYGLQRFGTTGIATHEIGVALLKADYENAVDLLLKPRAESTSREAMLGKMRSVWAESKDAKSALGELEKKHVSEAKVLKHLCGKETDYLGAISTIPRVTRLMYVHAVQSFVWNKLASYRVGLSQTELLVGDLVRAAKADKLDVTTVTEENKKNFKITDLVISLPGYDIECSEMLVAERDRILKEMGLTFASFDGKVKDYRLSGSYRHLIVKPDNTTAEVVKYASNEDLLLKSEKETLEGFNPPTENEPVDETKEKTKTGIIINFALPTSAYATMALREFMHHDQTE